MFGLDFTWWEVVRTLLLMFLVYVMYDWYLMLAWRRKYNVKGAFPVPFFGTILTVMANIGKLHNEMRSKEKYGPVFGGHMGSIKILQIADVDLLKKVLVKDHVKFQNRYTMDGLEPPPLDKHLLSLKDEHWKRVRSIVTPSFSLAKLKMMTKEMNRCADMLTEVLVKKAKAGEIIDPKEQFGCYTMDVISSTAFGIQTDSYSDPNDPFLANARKAFANNTVSLAMMLPILFPRFFKLLTWLVGYSIFFDKGSLIFFSNVTRKLIEDRQKGEQPGRVDLLQLMLNAEHSEQDPGDHSSKKLSVEELVAQGFLVFVAGYETTASLLNYVAYILATHPDIQDKLLDEVDAYFAQGVDEVNYDVLELPYLDQVICETLRRYPPLTRMHRTTSHDEDVQVDGYWFPSNTMIMFSIYMIHNELGIYEDPDEIRPERFSPEEKAKRDPFTFIPFGHGPRNCIGMRLALLEAKIAVVKVLRRIKFVQCPETQVPLELRIEEAFLKTKKPIKVAIELR